MNDKLETAVNLAWTAGNSNTRFGIAAKYQIDPDASFSVSPVHVHLYAFENKCLINVKWKAAFPSAEYSPDAVLCCVVGTWICLFWFWQPESTTIGFSLKETQNVLLHYWALF